MDNPATCANNVHLASSKYEAVRGDIGAVDPLLHQIGEVKGGFCIITQLGGGDHAPRAGQAEACSVGGGYSDIVTGFFFLMYHRRSVLNPSASVSITKIIPQNIA